MRKLLWLIVFFTLSSSAFASVNNIKEEDGSPDIYPWQLRVTNGSLTDNGDGTASLSVSGSSMVYPSVGIPLSTGSAWGTSITDSSANWNTAYGWGNHASAGYVTGTPWTSEGYLTSLSGAVLTDQSTPQTIGATGARLAKLWATDIQTTNKIVTTGIAPATDGTTAFQITKADGTTTVSSLSTFGDGTLSVYGDTAATLKLGKIGTASSYLQSTGTDIYLGTFSGAVYLEPATHLYINSKTGIGVSSPTARLHLKAGTATANTAPIKLNSGVLNTTAEAGAIEFLTDAYYATITTGAERKKISLIPVDAAITIAAAKTLTVPLDASVSGTNTGDQTTISGNAGTATALAANGGNCSAGNYPLGVDASGAVESCTAAPTQASLSVDDLVTLSGVADGAVNLGTFTGTTIADNQTIKAGLQALETLVETKDAVVTAGRSLTRNTNDIVADTELYTDFRSMTIESPTDADNIFFFEAPITLTVTRVTGIVEAATSAVLTVQECDSAGDNCSTVEAVTADVDGTISTSIDNASIDAGDIVRLDVGTVTGTVGQAHLTLTFTKDD